MNMTTSEFVGAERVKAWAEFSQGIITDGLGDGGKDIATNNSDVPHFQVKGCWSFARQHLAQSIHFSKFIPLVVGDPPRYTKETREVEWNKVRSMIRQFGGYVDTETPNRERLMQQISLVKARLCGT